PAAEHDPVERDPRQREHVQRPDRDIDSVEADALAEDALDPAERDDRERPDRGEDRDHRRYPEQEADARARARGVLCREFEDLREWLEQSERTDAVWPVAALEAPEQLAFVDDQHRQDREDHSE